MNKPLLHARTKRQIELLNELPHAILLYGSKGVGKFHVANFLATSHNLPVRSIEKEEKSANISIEQVRSLYSLTKSGVQQAIVIKDAHLLSKDAQNAFLKLLEEPPEHTHFILTATNKNSLLPTVQSRVQQVEVIAPTLAQIVEHFKDDSEDFAKLVRITNNRVGLIASARENADENSQIQTAMNNAKEFYVSEKYRRYKIIASLEGNKESVVWLIENLSTIITSLISSNKQQTSLLKKLLAQARLCEKTTQLLLTTNVSSKIQLTKLAEML